MEQDSIRYCEHRKMEEARQMVEILEQCAMLGKVDK